MTPENEEVMDIYDENRQLTGLTMPRRSFLQKGQFMLYVLGIIERPSDHRIIITQRSLDKRWAAGSWEVPGGGSMAGETSFEAVCRELKEETGIDIGAVINSENVEKKGIGCEVRDNSAHEDERVPVYSYRNEDLPRGDNYFVDIYHFYVEYADNDVTIQKSEAIAWKAATIEEIGKINEKEGFLHYDRILKALGLKNEYL